MSILSHIVAFICDQLRAIFYKMPWECIFLYIIAQSMHSKPDKNDHPHHLLQPFQMPAPTGILTDTQRMASWLTQKSGSQETQAIILRYPKDISIF